MLQPALVCLLLELLSVFLSLENQVAIHTELSVYTVKISIEFAVGELATSCQDYYALNFEEVEGAYWFGPVRLSV